jgi:hypothetical protein
MTMTDNNLLSNNKIKRFDTNYQANCKEKTSTIYPADQIEIDDDTTLICCDGICAECWNDHSFQPNFEGVMTSIDAIPKILPGLFY